MKKNTLYKFDEISKYSVYSKMNINYDRVLGDRSLKAFVKINKNPKKLKKISYVEEALQKAPKESKDYKDPHEFINQFVARSIENNNNKSKVFNTQPNTTPQSSLNHNFKKKNFNDIISLDPFKYNPNYNAIYKKIPYVRIVAPTEKDNNRNLNSSNSSSIKGNKNDKSKNNRIPSPLEENDANTIKSQDSYTIETNKNDEINNSNKSSDIKSIKLPIINNYNNKSKIWESNHALRFSKYGNQREYKSENKYSKKEEESGKNLNFIRYNNKNSNNRYRLNKNNKKYNFSINFDKMMSRKGTDFINSSSLATPSFNKYTPNYDFVKHSPAKISFSYHNIDIDNMTKKKYLLKKLLNSYNPDIQYHIIKDEQLKPSTSVNSVYK
jgi:hypothetical protein